MSELGKALRTRMQAREIAVAKLIEIARSIEPQLRDLNAHHTADRIAATLGELDELEASFRAHLDRNPEAAFAELLDMFRKERE